jgi:hypothetical protein
MPKKIVVAVVLILAGFVSSGRAAEPDPDADGWRLIHRDQLGNLLSVASATTEESTEGLIRVWVKYETEARNSPSPMLFLNDLDCAKGLIRRIEVRLYRPTCGGSGELVQSMSFAGAWDSPSTGIEEQIRDGVCAKEGDGSL